MCPYGRIYQIKKYYRNGFYESKVSVLLDTSSGYLDEDGDYQTPTPLTSNILLDKWNIIVPVWYRGADPVCGFCRFSGHKISKCPELKKQECFKCNNRGHTRNFCTKKDSNTELDTEDKDVVHKKTTVITIYDEDISNEILKAPSKPLRREDTDSDAGEDEDEEELPTAPKDFTLNPMGTSASKHASYKVALSMKIDSVEEMNDSQQEDTPSGKSKDLSTLKRKKKVYPPVSEGTRKKTAITAMNTAIEVASTSYSGLDDNQGIRLEKNDLNFGEDNNDNMSIRSSQTTQQDSQQAQC